MKGKNQEMWKDKYLNKIIHGNALECLRELSDNSIDLIVTDPPYGVSFMGKHWDKAVPSVDIWTECLRVLKPGAFAFVMSLPRQDVLSRMIVNLEDSGFVTGFTSIYWTYATGFPKAGNISKMVDKRMGQKQKTTYVPNYKNEVLGRGKGGGKSCSSQPISLQAKSLDGSFAGFQPKPAVEIILVVMKPLSEKTYVGQALKNGKGITWLSECKIPCETRTNQKKETSSWHGNQWGANPQKNSGESEVVKSRFPANLLVGDDVLDDGRVSKSHINTERGMGQRKGSDVFGGGLMSVQNQYNDSGQFSRFFSLDAWWEKRVKELPVSVQKTFPFLIIPKASKSEKNNGCEELENKNNMRVNAPRINEVDKHKTKMKNYHPTCKPVKLLSYLIT
jgi:site-specific DNA-methyltransferase (adenine-specific)